MKYRISKISNVLAKTLNIDSKAAEELLLLTMAQPKTRLQELHEKGIVSTDEQRKVIIELRRAHKFTEARDKVCEIILAENGIA